MEYSVSFPTGNTRYVEGASFAAFEMPVPARECIAVMDSNIAALYPDIGSRFGKTITIPAGETHKNWDTVQTIIEQLLEANAHKHSFIVGIGGGMITDITGFVAGIYMRGIPFGFVPTSLLGMVDAAIGGKNGINNGMQKNLLGTIHQPGFILWDISFLDTLPVTEWQNGFAEIIKYACLFDAAMFDELTQHDLDYYRQHKEELWQIIKKCIAYKNKTVQADETDSNTRKLLNFGHTAGHAIETLYSIPHGRAVAIGMVIACIVSQAKGDDAMQEKLASLLQRYGLPAHMQIEVSRVMEILSMDKKRNKETIDYIVLNGIGEGAIESLSFDVIEKAMTIFTHAGSH